MNEILNRTKDHFESLQDEASTRLPSSSLTKEEEKNIQRYVQFTVGDLEDHKKELNMEDIQKDIIFLKKG